MIVVVVAIVALFAGVMFNWLSDTLPVERKALAQEDNEEAESPFRNESKRLPSIYTMLFGSKIPHPKAAAPWRYPLVEIICPAVAVALMLLLADSTDIRLIKIAYVLFFVLVIIIDVEYKLILTAVMLPAFFFGIVEVILSRRISIMDGLAGYAFGQIVFMGMYLLGQAYVWFVNRRRTKKINTVAFGAGDVTLATFCGLLIGPIGIFPMIFLTVFLGGTFAILYLVLGTILKGRGNFSPAFPYGPSIAIAATIILLFGPDVALSLFF